MDMGNIIKVAEKMYRSQILADKFDDIAGDEKLDVAIVAGAMYMSQVLHYAKYEEGKDITEHVFDSIRGYLQKCEKNDEE